MEAIYILQWIIFLSENGCSSFNYDLNYETPISCGTDEGLSASDQQRQCKNFIKKKSYISSKIYQLNSLISLSKRILMEYNSKLKLTEYCEAFSIFEDHLNRDNFNFFRKELLASAELDMRRFLNGLELHQKDFIDLIQNEEAVKKKKSFISSCKKILKELLVIIYGIEIQNNNVMKIYENESKVISDYYKNRFYKDEFTNEFHKLYNHKFIFFTQLKNVFAKFKYENNMLLEFFEVFIGEDN
ncbi:hypothetical protein H312_01279 [Anncaliia algerae PRA339]|uniref:Uncharacterized protein n=1 Tax=Anncaliia algerae PRA339 TaxID=1288291 RepID=A0A059F1W4_9MICR|nr:hypothetical protein H312_01279 [Anncaliia algerae PRA339]